MNFFIKIGIIGLMAYLLFVFLDKNGLDNFGAKILEVTNPKSPREKLITNIGTNFEEIKSVIKKLSSNNISGQERAKLNSEGEKILGESRALLENLDDLTKDSDKSLIKTLVNKILPTKFTPTPTYILPITRCP